MSKSNTFENDVLKLVLHRVAISGIATDATSPLTSLYLALHIADPGENEAQTTNEATYTGYVRQAVSRSTSGFTISGSVATLAGDVLFPIRTDAGSAQQITHWSLGTSLSGTGKILYAGPISPTISVTQNTRPKLLAQTSIVED